jgi:hypothetical protein
MDATDKSYEPNEDSPSLLTSNYYIHIDGERHDKMKAAADAAAWRSGNRAAIMSYLVRADLQQAYTFWDHSHQLKAADEQDDFLESVMTKLAHTLSQTEYEEVEKEATRVWKETLAAIPYGEGFGTKLFMRLKEMPLQEVGPYLNHLCNKSCHPGLPRYFILNTATDAAYLRDILNQQVKNSSHAGHESITRAIQWLTEQAKYVASMPKTEDKAVTSKADSPSKPELNLRMIALLCFYQNRRITSANAAEIARSHGHASKTSGRDLKEYWDKWANVEAMNASWSKREAGYQIAAIHAVIPKLTSEQAAIAIKHISSINDKMYLGTT